MANLREYHRIVAEYGGVAQFAVIYVREDHATDSRVPFHNNVERMTAHKIEDRIESCRELVQLMGKHVPQFKDNMSDISFLVDNMRNELVHKLICQPDRLYIVEGHRVVFQGGYGPFGYSLDPVEQFLKERRAREFEGK